MSETDRFYSMSRQEQETILRQNLTKFFQRNPEYVELNIGILSDEVAARCRVQYLKETQERGDIVRIELFDLWLRVIREVLKDALRQAKETRAGGTQTPSHDMNKGGKFTFSA